MLAVLRHRNFALLWMGGLISMIGSSMLYVALPFYVYERTGSPLATGAIFITQLLPSLLFGSIAGVFVDRWDRRRTMISADLARAALILLLLAVRSDAWLWVVYAVALLEQLLSVFFGPANRALIPRLVGERQLLAANSLVAMSSSVTRLVGPALGGALMGLVGLPAVVLVDSLSYLVSAALISLITLAPQAPAESITLRSTIPGRWATFWQEWGQGLRLVLTDRLIFTLFVVTGLAMFADSVVLVLLVPFVQDVLGGGALDYGWMQTAIGGGGLLGAIIIGHVGRFVPPQRLLALAIGIVGGLTFLLANARSLALILSIEVLLGVAVTGWLVSQQTLLQRTVADQYRGRVFGTHATTTTLLTLCGMGLGGALAGPLGVIRALEVTAGLYLLAMVVALLVLRADAPDPNSQPDPVQTVAARLTDELFARIGDPHGPATRDLAPEMDAVLENMALDGVEHKQEVAAYVRAILLPASRSEGQEQV